MIKAISPHLMVAVGCRSDSIFSKSCRFSADPLTPKSHWLPSSCYYDVTSRHAAGKDEGGIKKRWKDFAEVAIGSPVSDTLTCCYAGFTVHLARARGSILE